MIDLNAIEAAAKAATPGPWVHGSDGRAALNNVSRFVETAKTKWNRVLKESLPTLIVYGVNTAQDAAHMAAANPATVLEMISMIRERDAVLRQALEALEGLFGIPKQWTGEGGGVAVWRLGGSAAPKDAIAAIKKVLGGDSQQPGQSSKGEIK